MLRIGYDPSILNRSIREKDYPGILNWFKLKFDQVENSQLTTRHYQYIISALIANNEVKRAKALCLESVKKFNCISILNLLAICYRRDGDSDGEASVLKVIINHADLNEVLADKFAKRYAFLSGSHYNRKTLLLESNTCIQYIQSGKSRSDTVFITFWGAGRDNSSSEALLLCTGYAQKFLMELGVDLIIVKQKKYNFFQDLCRSKFNSAVFDFIALYKKIYTYGGSGGGYAALYYAVDINAIPIAFSPRIRIDSCTGLKVAADDAKLVHVSLDELKSSQKCYVFFDPMYTPDSSFYFERVVKCFNNVEPREIVHMGHGAFFLSEIGEVKNIVKAILLEKNLNIPINKRKDSKIYHFNFFRYLYSRNKPTLGKIIAERGLALGDHPTKYDKIHIYNESIKAMLSFGDLEGAMSFRKKYLDYPWFLDSKNRFSSNEIIIKDFKSRQKT